MTTKTTKKTFKRKPAKKVDALELLNNEFCIVDDLDVVIVKDLSRSGADLHLYEVLKHHPSASIGLTQDYSEEYTEAGEVVPLSTKQL